MEKEKVSNIEQLCSVTEYIAAKGKAKGTSVLEVNNGSLSFSVTPDCGMDIYAMRFEGENVAFLSKNGLTKNNADGSFVSRFCGGFLYTCGLEAIGVTDGCPQHGSYHNLPASNWTYDVCDGEVIISGTVKQTALFGSNLTVCRTIKTAYGSGKIEITDTVKNEGYKDDKYVLLYHFNLGYPFLDDGVTIEADISDTAPLSDYAAADVKNALIMCEPKNTDEQVYCHTLKTKKGEITVKNLKRSRQIKFSYDAQMLPCFTEWKSMQKGDYALGIEPATSSFVGDRQYRTLKSGESAVFKIEVDIDRL